MIPIFLTSVIVTSLLLACAALAAERVAVWYGRSRRWIWVAAICASVVLPLISPWTSRIMARNTFVSRSAQLIATFQPVADVRAERELRRPHANTPVSPAAIDMNRALQFAWIGLSLTMFVCVAVAYARLRSVRVRAAVTEIDGELVLAVERAGPAVIGIWHPAIVVPRWVLLAPADEQRLIILHEREHINARDPWLLVFATLATIAMPWNVVLWWQHLRLRLAMETDCDARVLARVGNRDLYGRMLIRTAGDTVALPTLAPAWGERAPELKHRILAMTARPPRGRFVLAATCVVLAGAATFAACAATARPGETTAAAPRAATQSSVVPGHEFALPGRGYVRVVGYTRERIRTRVVLTGIGASLETDDGTATVHGDTLWATTPVVFRVVTKGVADYRLVAYAAESGTEVEIQGIAPVGYPFASAASARGGAPMLNYGYTIDAIPGPAAPPVEPAHVRAETPDVSRAPANFEAGTIHIESENGDRVSVRISSNISFRARGPGMRSNRSDGTMEVVTPANVTLTGTGAFAIVFEPVDPATGIRVSVDGRPGDGLVRASAGSGARQADLGGAGGAIAVWKCAKGFGIRGVASGTRAPDVKCE